MLIRSILCPVDFSERSEDALRVALKLAEKLGAEIRLVHVFQPPAMAVSETTLADARRGLAHDLEALARRYSGHGVAVTPRLLDGVPYEEIVAAAEDSEIGLVVMGTHGRHSLPRYLLGSVAERVVRLSRVPVCTVRHGGR
jgi:nucleotide-binding universal stress UspA family protein